MLRSVIYIEPDGKFALILVSYSDIIWVEEEDGSMELYREIDSQTEEMLLAMLLNGTVSGKLKWEELDYSPISFVNGDMQTGEPAYLSQMFALKTNVRGIQYELELLEQITLSSGMGDITGTLICQGDVWEKYDFALSYDERYEEADAGQLKEMFKDTTVAKLADAVVSVFDGTDALKTGFSYASYYNEKQIDPKWQRMPLTKLGQRLMEEKGMKEFHQIILDLEYRNRLMELRGIMP